MKARLSGLTPAFLLMVGTISSCTSTTVENWPTERLDKNPTEKPVAVTVADIDGDGLHDVISLWRGGTNSSPAGAVVVHFQESDGTWTSKILDSNSRYANAKAINQADMNIDGHPDVLVAANDRLVYLQAPSDPREGSWKVYEITESINSNYQAWYDIAATQIDGAHGLDLVATLNDANRLVWFEAPTNPNTGDGWELHTIDSTTRSEANSIKLADMDGDGRTDVVCSATGDTSAVISWYKQPANAASSDASAWKKYVMTKFSGATRFALGDLNGDGLMDLVAVSPNKRQVAWFPHPDDVTDPWDGWILVDYSENTDDDREPVDVAIADMNNDGQQDVVVIANEPACAFWYTPGTNIQARWTSHRIAAIADVSYGLSAVDDLDGDGLVDVVVPVDHDDDDDLDRVDWLQNSETAQ